MFEYIFTIGCFEKLHKGNIKLLEDMQKQSKKIIIGLHDNDSIKKIKNISDIDSYDNRKKNLAKYAYDVFKIDDVDPTKSIHQYILLHYCNKEMKHYNQVEPIIIGSSDSNRKIIKNNYTGDLFFIHNFKDTFEYYCKDDNITVIRTDNNRGWGQNLIGYKKNWCFISGDDSRNFRGIDYIKNIMPIQCLPNGVIFNERYNFNDIKALNNTIKKEALEILVVSYGGSCSEALVHHLEKNNYKCTSPIWRNYLCHCPTYINVNIPIIYIYDNPIKSFLSQKRRGNAIWGMNQKKLNNDNSVELSDEMLLKSMIKQFHSWTNSNIDNLLVIKSDDLFNEEILKNLKKILGKPLSHFPLKYKKPNINNEDIENFKSTELFKKYRLDIEKIINYK